MKIQVHTYTVYTLSCTMQELADVVTSAIVKAVEEGSEINPIDVLFPREEDVSVEEHLRSRVILTIDEEYESAVKHFLFMCWSDYDAYRRGHISFPNYRKMYIALLKMYGCIFRVIPDCEVTYE